jgi:hypothetical protein
MLHGNRVDIDVGHAGKPVHALRDLVRILNGRQARADINELTHPVHGCPAHSPPQEIAVIVSIPECCR